MSERSEMSTGEEVSTGKRSYSNSLRKQQSDLTRELILRALNELVAENRILTLTVEDVAEKAGVSHRSVYRHFPTKEALFEALYKSNEEIMDPFKALGPPASIDEIPALAVKVFANFDEHSVVARSLNIASIVSGVQPPTREERDALIKNLLVDVTSNLDKTEARRAFAVIRYMLGALAWHTLRDRFKLDGADAGKAVSWALAVLIKDLRDRNTEAERASK